MKFKDFKMKSLVVQLMCMFVLLNGNAQTAVGKQTVSSPSVLLDFGSGTTRGIILPAVESIPAAPANGTFLFDRNDSIVKMFENGVWVQLSSTGDDGSIVPYTGTVDTGKQTVMGAQTTAVDGVLVLESSDKAMVLPHIANPHIAVKSPYPGMMCYDTYSKSVAVFDGAVWNYWK